jgi:hypothetical protein
VTKRKKVDSAFRPLGIKFNQLTQEAREQLCAKADIVAFIRLTRDEVIASEDLVATISIKLRDVGKQLMVEAKNRGWS